MAIIYFEFIFLHATAKSISSFLHRYLPPSRRPKCYRCFDFDSTVSTLEILLVINIHRFSTEYSYASSIFSHSARLLTALYLTSPPTPRPG